MIFLTLTLVFRHPVLFGPPHREEYNHGSLLFQEIFSLNLFATIQAPSSLFKWKVTLNVVLNIKEYQENCKDSK